MPFTDGQLPVLKPVYHVEALGEQAVVPDGAILNIGGVAGPTFTVGGKALLFADGTSTSTDVVTRADDFQSVYERSVGEAFIDLSSGKDLVLEAVNGKQLRFDADTGTLTLTGQLVVLGSSQTVVAKNVYVDPTELQEPITGTNVQEVIENITTVMSSLTTQDLVRAYEHVQLQPLTTWTITHGQNTRRVQISVWDNFNELIHADAVTIADDNTVVISYNTPVTGRAVLMLF